jgi:hypothetical protein
MLAAALVAEVATCIEAHAEDREERGRRLVVRNGRPEPRVITTSAGPIEINQPRVNDMRTDEETGERVRFRRSIIPPWYRKSPAVAKALPLITGMACRRVTSCRCWRTSSALGRA